MDFTERELERGDYLFTELKDRKDFPCEKSPEQENAENQEFEEMMGDLHENEDFPCIG